MHPVEYPPFRHHPPKKGCDSTRSKINLLPFFMRGSCGVIAALLRYMPRNIPAASASQSPAHLAASAIWAFCWGGVGRSLEKWLNAVLVAGCS